MRTEFASERQLDLSREADVLREFKRATKQRHARRQDLKSRVAKRDREICWESLVEEAMTGGQSRTQARLTVLQNMKEIVNDIVRSFVEDYPGLQTKFQQILQSRRKMLHEEALQEGADDSHHIIAKLDGATALKGEDRIHMLQMLSQVSKNVHRYFVCRAESCSPSGQFIGESTAWPTTDPYGWHFACPACGCWYRPGCSGQGAARASTHVWVVNNKVMVAEWPSTESESSVLSLMELYELKGNVDHADPNLTHEEVMAKICSAVERHGTPVGWVDMQMTEQALTKIREMNANPTRVRKHPFRFDHLLKGFKGSFVRTESAPMMSVQDMRDLLSLVQKHTAMVSRM
jgi:hypothetical protein